MTETGGEYLYGERKKETVRLGEWNFLTFSMEEFNLNNI
jgi:hypothetical protein